ncbi:DUF883 family protein [Mitsuaria sp. CC2]|uniref:DUF883 family protein n=1 Tax=Mitsuaria sp. CC2 TaxID=3029186 RepID=UPI003B8E561B
MAKTSSSDRLLNDLHQVVTDAESLLRATADQTSAGASELRARVQTTLDRAKSSLGEFQAAAVDRAKAAGKATDDYVHDNPWQSVGVAAGVGLLIGLLLTSRR